MRPFIHRLTAPLALLAIGLAFVACGDDGTATPTAAPATATATQASATATATATEPAADGALTIEGSAFKPASLTVAAGTTVTVQNKDGFAHTVTADDGSFDTSSIAGGTTATVDLPSAGTFAFHCAIHTSMKGAFVVE